MAWFIVVGVEEELMVALACPEAIVTMWARAGRILWNRHKK